MQIVDVLSAKQNHSFTWPGGDTEMFGVAVTYEAVSADGKHEVTVGYGERATYGTKRRRVVVWIDDYPRAEFMGADDFKLTGEVLSEVRIFDDSEESTKMCRYGSDVVPQRYSLFRNESLKRRVSGVGVHDAWAVVVNVADHASMIALASMRKYEKGE